MRISFCLLGVVAAVIGLVLLGVRIERQSAQSFYLDLIKSLLHQQSLVVEPLVATESGSRYKAIEQKLLLLMEEDGLDLANKLAVASNYLNDLRSPRNKLEVGEE